MKVIQAPSQFQNSTAGLFCTIGMFDGLHRGHQAVIDYTLREATRENGIALAITFAPHPAKVVAPSKAPDLIYPFTKRRELLTKTALDVIWEIPFDEAFSQINGAGFIDLLATRFAPLKLICVGPDFHFGHQRSGNRALLKAASEQHDFRLPDIVPVTEKGSEVSSTIIRKLIREGDLNQVATQLGRAYELCGTVVTGDCVGRSLGFPTANLDTTDLVLPPRGVYAIKARHAQSTLTGVMNIGVRPTRGLSENQPRVEAHFFDFDDDLYGKPLALQPVQRLRSEQTFPSLDALKDQIAKDCQQAREVLHATAT